MSWQGIQVWIWLGGLCPSCLLGTGIPGNLSECLGSHIQGHDVVIGTLSSPDHEGRGCGCLEGQELVRLTSSRMIRETQYVHVAYQGPISQHLTTSPSHPSRARVVMEGGRRQRATQEGCISIGMAAEPVRRMWQCQKRVGQARLQDALVSFSFL